MGRKKGAYARGDLLAALVVEFGVGLAEDVVALILDAAGFKIPFRSLVSGFGVDMGPDLGVGRDKGGWADSSDRS